MKTKAHTLISISIIIFTLFFSSSLINPSSIIGTYINEKPVFIATWQIDILPNNVFRYNYRDCVYKKYSEGNWRLDGNYIILNSSESIQELFEINRTQRNSGFKVKSIENVSKDSEFKPNNQKQLKNKELLFFSDIRIEGNSVNYVDTDTLEIFEDYKLLIDGNRLISSDSKFKYIKENR